MVGRIQIHADGTIEAKLPIQVMREGSRIVFYTPALDICGYGDSTEHAKRDFDNALKIFFDETLEHHTLDRALEETGWKKVVSNTQEYWEPQTELITSSIESITIPK